MLVLSHSLVISASRWIIQRLLLIRSGARRQLRYHLYIPLCLYFNIYFAPSSSLSFFLYIPLCLYFNSEKRACSSPKGKLYIPLCLYFNTYDTREMSVLIDFTFHYVSILIDIWHSCTYCKTCFTFHYVSILIQLRICRSAYRIGFTFHYVSILI